MITLALDGSTYSGDVALLEDDRVLGEASTPMKGADSERLMPAVAQVLREVGLDVTAVQRVVCGAGPGSFTSLRIAAAIAKGIAVGVDVPLYAVSSLALIAGAAPGTSRRYLAALDALRGQFYIGLYGRDGGDVVPESVAEIEPPRLVAAAEVSRVAASAGATVVSPSVDLGGIVTRPRARAVVLLEAVLAATGPVDVGSWEPVYGRLAEAQARWEAQHRQPLPDR